MSIIRRFVSSTVAEGPIKSLRASLGLLKSSPTILINEQINERLSQNHKVFHFGFGQSPFPVPKPIVSALKDNAAHNEYLPVVGYRPLIEAIVKSECPTRSEDDIILGPGSKELLYLIQMAYEADLILPAPTWVSYVPHAIIAGNIGIISQTSYDDKYNMTAESLTKALEENGNSNRPRILLLTHPNNPTSMSYSLEEMNKIVEVCRKYRVLLISDEIYGRLNFEGKHITFADIYPEGAIVTSGLSKWAGAGGWRVGYASFPPQLRWLRQACLNLASNTYTTVAAPIQYASVNAFSGHEAEIEDYLYKTRTILKALCDYSYDILTDAGSKLHHSDSAFYAFPDFSNCKKADKWLNTKSDISLGYIMASDILKNCGVAFLPGEDFLMNIKSLTARLALTQFNGEKALYNFTPNIDEKFIRKYCPLVCEGLDKLSEYLKE